MIDDTPTRPPPFNPMCQPIDKFENHYNCCKSDYIFFPEAEVPNPEYKFAFQAYDVLVKSPFVRYLDVETIPIPVDSSSGVMNACHRHEAIAVEYTIVDRNMEVRAYECFIGVDNISEKLQQSILDESRNLYKDYCNDLCSKACLTSADKHQL